MVVLLSLLLVERAQACRPEAILGNRKNEESVKLLVAGAG